MTIEIKIITSNEDIPTWLMAIAQFTKQMKPAKKTRQLYVKIGEST